MSTTPYPVDPDVRIEAFQSALEQYAIRFKEQTDRIEQLEAALRLTRPYIEMHTLNPNGTMATVLAKIDAALAQSSPPARQENDDVFKGFRGNNEA